MCDKRNQFCYARGLFVDKQHRLQLSKNRAVVKAFNVFFNCSYVESAWYEPQYVFSMYFTTRKQWKSGKCDDQRLPFVTPMAQHYQPYHKPEDCYFCQTIIVARHYKTRHHIKYVGVFIGPEIRKLMIAEDFVGKLNQVEKSAWLSFISLCKNFLGNKRRSNYVEVANEILEAHGEMGYNMSIKIHFLHSHLELFPENLSQLSDEQGERFHQKISTIERRFAGNIQVKMLANYCWSLKRETDDSSHKRKRSSKHF